jgi:hypothetical protein
MAMTERTTLLEPGHDATWDRLGREKRAALRWSVDTPVEELLRAGQRLSAQAAALRRALEDGRRSARS